MKRPLILDLYCKAGGASRGYHDVGFDVVGVDIEPQPNYPYPFILGDVLDMLPCMIQGKMFLASDCKRYGIDDFVAIHTSPPCQRYSSMQHIHKNKDKHPDLIDPTRQILLKTNKFWVIENVEHSPLRIDLMLCGTMFDIRFPKHRIFEINFNIVSSLPVCNHSNVYDPYHGGEMARKEREKLSELYGIDWFMTRSELRNCIPPAYTRFIGGDLMKALYD